MRSPGPGFGSRAGRAAVRTSAFVLVATLTWAGAAAAESSRSEATITGVFADGCHDFTSHATKVGSERGKDISHVEIASWSIDFGDGTTAIGSWSTDPPTEVTHDYSRFFADCVGGIFGACPVTLTVTDFAGQSDSDTLLMAFVDQTPD